MCWGRLSASAKESNSKQWEVGGRGFIESGFIGTIRRGGRPGVGREWRRNAVRVDFMAVNINWVLGTGRFRMMKRRAPGRILNVFVDDGMGNGKSGLFRSVGWLGSACFEFELGA